jgi:NAD(P)H-hydrate epimerase
MTGVGAEVPADLRVVPRRSPTSHKGDFGRILVVGGSVGMHGAPLLAAAAALRSGAGLVTIALPRSIYAVAGPAELRATWRPLPDSPQGHLDASSMAALLGAIALADVVALGPGLGTAPATVALLQELVPRIDKPLVLDADGLNAFAGEPARIAGRRPATILTPHPGELERLTGHRPGVDDESRRLAALDLAMRVGGTVVLKGHRSVVSNGLESHFTPTGNPGMATGGAGDVLTGCVAALLQVIRNELLAARVAAHAHGRAGDLAAAAIGEIGVTATDLLAHLPEALAAHVA